MAGTIAPFPKHTFLTNSGVPAVGYQLFAYQAGTTTKLDTYTDSALSAANTNPIILDSAGRATIFLSPTSYKFVLATPTDTDPPASPVWTVDNVSATPEFNVNLDVSGVAGVDLTANEVVYLSSGSGGLTAGRWYKADADFTYASTTAPLVGIAVANVATGVAGSIRISGRVTGYAGLTIGSVYYVSQTAGALTTVAPTNKRAVAIADTATTIVLCPVEGANETVGPLPSSIGALPAVSGAALTGVTKHLEKFIATVGNVGAGEDILATYTLPAGTITTDGSHVRGLFWGITANNANAKTIRVRVIEGGNNTVLIAASATVSEAGYWLLGFVAMRTDTTLFRAAAQFVVGPSNSTATNSVPNITGSSTVTWANAIEFRLTGEATANDDVAMQGGYLQISTV